MISDQLSKKGNLVVISGPSGVGKGTIGARLLEHHDDLCFSVSATTRPMREGEQEGVNYYYKTMEQFAQMIENGEFLEYMQVFGKHFYGTPRAFVEEKLANGISVLLDIDVHGARVVKKNYPEAVMLFIAPPSLVELRRRLIGRGTDSPEAVESRLAEAKAELAAVEEYDYVIVNDDLDTAVEDAECVLRSSRLALSEYKRALFEMLNAESV